MDTGGAFELLLVEPVSGDAEAAPGENVWRCITAQDASSIGQRAILPRNLAAEPLAKNDNGTWDVRLCSAEPLMAVLEQYGLTGATYIHRSGDERQARLDRERYQTVYARETGAVAAQRPVAFTESLFDALAAKGVQRATVTLHVGPGTFKPVKTDTVEAHRMDAERYAVPAGHG